MNTDHLVNPFPMHHTDADIVLEVLNPRAQLETPAPVAPSQRLGHRTGSIIGLYWNGKLGADHFLDALAVGLADHFPNTQIVRLDGTLDPGDPGAAALAAQADAFVYGVGD